MSEKETPKDDSIETVTISKKDYEELRRDSVMLSALEEFGVDNWQGYEDAMESINDDDDE